MEMHPAPSSGRPSLRERVGLAVARGRAQVCECAPARARPQGAPLEPGTFGGLVLRGLPDVRLEGPDVPLHASEGLHPHFVDGTHGDRHGLLGVGTWEERQPGVHS